MSILDFIVLGKLGRGTYSDVLKARRKADGTVYALKRVNFKALNRREKDNALNEIRILASISHPNVVAYKEAFFERNTLYIVMELSGGGDLAQTITRRRRLHEHFSEAEIWDIFIQTARGLAVLHRLSVVHRDLKSANLFFGTDNTVRLGDMNVSKVAHGLLSTQTGTPYYTSPEVWRALPYDSKSDIWSLGCVLHELASLTPPFTAPDLKGLCSKILRADYGAIPKRYSEALARLVHSLLKVDPSERPTCEEILDTPLARAWPARGHAAAECHLLESIHLDGNLPSPRYLPSPPPAARKPRARKLRPTQSPSGLVKQARSLQELPALSKSPSPRLHKAILAGRLQALKQKALKLRAPPSK